MKRHNIFKVEKPITKLDHKLKNDYQDAKIKLTSSSIFAPLQTMAIGLASAMAVQNINEGDSLSTILFLGCAGLNLAILYTEIRDIIKNSKKMYESKEAYESKKFVEQLLKNSGASKEQILEIFNDEPLTIECKAVEINEPQL